MTAPNPFAAAFAATLPATETLPVARPPRPSAPAKASAMLADLFPHTPRAPVAFVVPGVPFPWQRARVSGKRQFTSPEMREAMRLIRDCARQAGVRPVAGPVGIDVVASWLFPRAWKDHEVDAVLLRVARDKACFGAPKVSRGDIDNHCKIALDALNPREGSEGVAYEDDAQVWLLRGVKVFGPRSETRVRVWYGAIPPAMERWW